MALEAYLYAYDGVDPEDLLTLALKLALSEHGEGLVKTVCHILAAYKGLMAHNVEENGDAPLRLIPANEATGLYLKTYQRVYKARTGHTPEVGDILFPDAFPDAEEATICGGALPRKFVVIFAKATAQSDLAHARAYHQWVNSPQGQAQIAQWRGETPSD